MKTINQKPLKLVKTVKISSDNSKNFNFIGFLATKIFKLVPYRINNQIRKQYIFWITSSQFFNLSILDSLAYSEILYLKNFNTLSKVLHNRPVPFLFKCSRPLLRLFYFFLFFFFIFFYFFFLRNIYFLFLKNTYKKINNIQY